MRPIPSIFPPSISNLDASLGRWRAPIAAAVLLSFACAAATAQRFRDDEPFLPAPVVMSNTSPTSGVSKGDQNPYGVAFVPNNFQTTGGPLNHGDILVTNWNNASNAQGTGSTIMQVVPTTGKARVFFQGKLGIAPSTALGVLQFGLVVTGSSPTADGTFATAKPGALLVINNRGKLIQTFANKWIDAPWDLTVDDHGDWANIYVTNALNGTVSRLTFTVSSTGLTMTSATTIASGYVHQGSASSVFIAPTGMVYDRKTDLLYVASTGDNAVFAVPSASSTTDNGPGYIVFQDDTHLHGALAMAQAPNGHLLVSSSDSVNAVAGQYSEIVEFTKQGDYVKSLQVDPAQGGAFGLAVKTDGGTAVFAAVDDATNMLDIWTLNAN